MTEKQIEKIRTSIKRHRAALAAEKRGELLDQMYDLREMNKTRKK